MRYALLLLLVCCTPAAMHRPDEFRNRAAFEMHCPREELVLTYLENEAWGVTGCGKQATYQRIGKAWVRTHSSPSVTEK
jgi:hypothetical protein